MAQHRIDGCAHDDAPAHWPSNDLPVGMNTGILAQVPASADRLIAGRNHPWHTQARSVCRPTHGQSLPHPRRGLSRRHRRTTRQPSWHSSLVALLRPACRLLSTTTANWRYPSQHIALSSLATLPPGLPTGSKADASFEATGELSTWPLPFGDLALASWQKH